MPAQPIVVGGTYDWFLNPAKINTRASPKVFGIWDLTDATITISFLTYGNGPDATPTASYEFTASVISASDGTANYINTTSLFDVAGTWGVSWHISTSGTVLESAIEFFEVKASGKAL